MERGYESLELHGHHLAREGMQSDPEKNQCDNSDATAHICNSGAKSELNGQLFELVST